MGKHTHRTSVRMSERLGIAVLLLAGCGVAIADAPDDDSTVARTKAARAAGELVPPEVIVKTQKAPIYPAAARASRVNGWVVVETTIDVEGQVIEARARDCTHPNVGLEQAAIDAVREWKFRPALHRGEPVEYTTRYRLSFGRHAAGVSGAAATQVSMARKAKAPSPGEKVRPRRGSSVGNKRGTAPARHR